MAGKPAEPPPGQEDERERQEERAGPVAVERHVKDDGRALILYCDDRRGRA